MKTKSWHRTLGAWAFFPILYLAIFISNINLWWISLSFIVYISIATTVSVGYHRLFCHNAFVCSKLWHWVFGLIGAISLNSSPVAWSAVHNLHHKHSDTLMDPYENNLKYFLRFKERTNVKAGKNELRMMRNSMHRLLMNHSLTLSLVTGIILILLSPTFFLFSFALPVSAYLVASGIQTIYSHQLGSPRNLWYMEFIIPMSGEWIHKEHHTSLTRYIFNHRPEFFDLGGILIKAIEHGKQ